MARRSSAPEVAPTGVAGTAPVLAVLVCHDGARWLPAVLSSLRRLAVGPQALIAVDTGSVDATPGLLAAADDVVDEVLTLRRDSGFGAAVAAAVGRAEQRWGDPGTWVWLLHDDCAPEPDCLDALLSAAEVAPSAGLLGPLALAWEDPQTVIEAGVSVDAAGHRRPGIGATELDLGRFERNTEVLAVSSAGALIRRDVWRELGGYDPSLPLLRDDLDFGWRANNAAHLVMCVPAARLRHAAALARGDREPDALAGRPRAVDRAHGLWTYLANCSTPAFLLGLPRLVLLGLLRATTLLLLRRAAAAGAELAALGQLICGRAGLRAARRARRGAGSSATRGARGLLVSRTARLRRATRGGLRAAAVLGRLPEPGPGTAAPHPAGTAGPGTPPGRPGGVLPRLGAARPAPDAATRPRPSPRPRDGSPVAGGNGRAGRLPVADADPRRWLRDVLLAPAVLLVAATAALAVLLHRGRLGLDLAGGRLLPVEGLGATWAAYLAEWHPVGGGTAAAAPPALAVLGVLGAPFGSPAAAVSALLVAAPPLAALSAYLATRSAPAGRVTRALVAGAYAVLPVGTAAIAQGRLDVVVAHVLLPAVLAGTAAVLRGGATARRGGLLATASATALGLAVIGAFAPGLHLLVLAVAVIGFVLAPAARAVPLTRLAGLFALVLLPLGLLLPWPAVVAQRPSVLLHGVGAVVPEQWPGWAGLLTLDPGGPGAARWVGGLVVGAALLAALLRPRRAMLPGLGLVLVGAAGAAALGSVAVAPLAGGAPRPGFTGAPLLLAAAGLLWVVLVARTDPAASGRGGALSRRVLPLTAAAALAALAGGAALAGAAGPLAPRSQPVTLAPSLAAELARDGSSVLLVGDADEPVRLTRGHTPHFGDDSIPPLPSTVARLDGVGDALRGDDPDRVEAVLADVAALGVEFVVLPTTEQAQQVLATAGTVARPAPPTAQGRPVLRLLRPSRGAELLGPQLSGQARSGASPPVGAAPTGVPVAVRPPTVAAQVAPGADDRLLVLAANDEPGWRASVAGQPVPTVRAWGHQVAVEVPGRGAEVKVDRSGTGRTLLLLTQGAVVLLVALTAVPSWRRRDRA